MELYIAVALVIICITSIYLFIQFFKIDREEARKRKIQEEEAKHQREVESRKRSEEKQRKLRDEAKQRQAIELKRKEEEAKRKKELEEKRRLEEKQKKLALEARQRRQAELRRQQAEIKRQEELERTRRHQQAIEQFNTSRRKKNNWHQFQTAINQNNIRNLYHFTDRSNIKSIKENGGLFSWKYCERNRIEISRPGGDDWSRDLDRRYNLEDYVRLSFTRNHPMMYVARNQGRISNPVVLEISTDVILWTDTRYSNMNATKTGHSEGGALEDFNNIHFETVRQRTHFDLPEEEKKYYQAEVMVKSFIPLSYIKNINRF